MKRGNIESNRKGASMSMPFTMIFSIILVAVVIFVGFYVINMLLNRTEQVELNLLPREIQDQVVRIWSSSEAQQTINLDCSNKVEYICFVDFSMPAKGTHSSKFNELKNFPGRENANFFYYPLMTAEDYSSFTDWYINCNGANCLKISSNYNPLCVKVVGGKVKFELVKEYGEAYVRVEP